MVEAGAVDEERTGRDRGDAGGEPVEAVDEVDGVGHADDPQHGHERATGRVSARRCRGTARGRRSCSRRRATARCPPAPCRRASPAPTHLAVHLAQLVDQPDREDHHRTDDDAQRHGARRRTRRRTTEQPGHAHPDQDAGEHRDAADVRHRLVVHAPARPAPRRCPGTEHTRRTSGVSRNVVTKVTPNTTTYAAVIDRPVAPTSGLNIRSRVGDEPRAQRRRPRRGRRRSRRRRPARRGRGG